MEAIYLNYPLVRKMILSNGGSSEDAKDIFQESVIIFYRLCRKPGFHLSSSISTLVYAISKKLWLKKIRDYYSRIEEIKGPELLSDEAENVEDEEEEVKKISLMENVMKELGDPCRELLIKFYYEKISMRDIATLMGYSGEKTAKAQKYKCLERAKKMVAKFKEVIMNFQR